MKTLANIELIWALFIIITVIAQIVKGTKKVSSQAPGKTEEGAPGSPRESQERSEREDELRKFLETLAGGQPSTPKPTATPSTPPPVPRTTRSVDQTPTRRRPRRPAAAKPTPPPEPIRVAPPPPVPVLASSPVKPVVVMGSKRKSVLGEQFRRDLKEVGSARNSIVLREVLGPPIGLRPLEWRV